MSTVDNRVVRMQFDNAQFEAGVAKSMKTLDMLNEKLQFKEGAKGLSSLLVTIEGVSSKSAAAAINALDRVSDYTTTVLGMMAQKVKSQFADKIVAAIESIPTKAMAQIKSGGWNRAMNIANAQFQIEGLKFSWDAVRKAADYAVTDTAYGLDAAAKAASQLAASGVDFEKVLETDAAGNNLTQMHKSLRAISGVAAMTNSSYEDIAHTFTRIAGQGRVMGEDLNSLASRGLNAAATLAKAMGITESEVRDMVSKGAIDFHMFSEAMDEAYGEHAKEANKTFSGALSNMKAALSRIGAIFAQPVIDKTNTFFISVTSRIKEFQKALNDTTGYKITEKGLENIKKKAKEAAKARKDLTTETARSAFIESETNRLKSEALGSALKSSLDAGDVESYSIVRFAGHFAEAWESAVKAASTVVDSLDLTWFKDLATFLDNIAIKAKNFFDGITDYFNNAKAKVEAASEVVQNLTDISLKDFQIINQVMAGTLGTMETRWNAIDNLMGKEGEGKRIQGYIDQLAAVEYSYEKMGWTADWIKDKEKEEAGSIEDTASAMAEKVKEAKVAAYEASKELSTEEALYSNIAYWLGVTKNAVSDIKTVIGNTIKSIGNLGGKVVKVFSYFNAISVNTRFDNITREVAGISDAVYKFVDSIEFTQSSIDSFGDALSSVGEYVIDLYQALSGTIKEFFEFAAVCMASEESLEDLAEKGNLTPIQVTTISVLRVLKNLWKTITNIAKAIASVVKPIVKAFRNVFNPSGIASGVADFSEGIANLSEKLILSEDAAKAVEVVFGGLFSVIQKVATIFTKAVGSVTKFVTSIGKTKKSTKETTESIEEVEEAGEKTTTVFESLKTLFDKFIKKIQELPEKFEEFKKKLEENEGIQHLKNSFENLWETIKTGFTTSLEPLKADLSEVAEVTGGEGTTAIGAFADGIGNVADKIATFIDNIPTYISEIEGFFDRLKEKAEGLIEKLHITNLFDSIGNAFDVTAETEGSITDKIKAFATQIYDKVSEVVESVDWKKVTKAGLIGIIFGNLFQFIGIASQIKTLIANVAAVPKTITGILGGLKGFLTQGTATLKRMTDIAVFVAIIESMASLVAAVVLFADMDEEKLKKGVAAVTWIGLIVALIASQIGKMGAFNVQKEGKVVDKSTKGIIAVNQQLSGPLGLAAVIGAFAGGVWLVLKAISSVIEATKGANPDELGNAIKIIGASLITLILVIAGLFLVANKVRFGKNEVKVFSGIGIALAGFGVAVWLIAQAIKSIQGVQLSEESIIAIVGIISGLILFTYILGKAAHGVNVKSVIGIGAVIAILGGVLFVILGELIGLTFIMGVMANKGQGDVIIAALGVIVSLILAMAAFGYLLGKGAKNLEKTKGVGTIMLSIGGSIALACLGFKSIAETMKDVDDPVIVIESAIVLMVSLLIMVVGVAGVIKSIEGYSGSFKKDPAKAIFAIASVFAAMGVAMWLIGQSAKAMGDAMAANGGDAPILHMVIMLALMVALMAGLVAVVTTDKIKVEAIVDTLMSISIAFLAIGVGMMALGKAAQLFGSISASNGLGPMIAILVGLFVGLGVLSALAGGTKLGDGLDKLATFFVAFGIAMILVAGAVALLGIGLGTLGTGIGALSEGLAKLTAVLSDNPYAIAAMIVAVAIIAAIIVLAWKLASTINSVVPVIMNVLSAGFEMLKTIVEAVGGFLKDKAKDLSTKWKGFSNKVKMGVVAVIVAISGALMEATPEMLENIKKVLKKVLYFIIDIIPTIVDALIDILIRLINSLADSIRKNSSAIVNALLNVVEALLELIIEVIVQANTFILNFLDSLVNKALEAAGIDKKIKLFGKFGNKIEEIGTGVKASLREAMAATNDYASGTEIMTQAMSGLDSSMNKVTSDITKQKQAMSDAQEEGSGLVGLFSSIGDKAGEATKGFDFSSLIPSLDMSSATDGLMSNIGLENMTGGMSIDASSMIDTSSMQLPDGMGMDMLESGNLDPDFIGPVGWQAGDAYTNEFAEGINNEDSRAQIEDATDSLMDSAADVVAARKKELVENTIPKAMHDMYSSMVVNANDTKYGAGPVKFGEFIVSSLVASVRNQLIEAEKAGNNIAGAVNQGFVDPMKIESPSKVFYQNGLYCIQGLQNGVAENTHLATNAMTSLSDQMIDSFGNPLDYISKVASGDIAYDPTIRPVMDMSDAYRASLDVNSMFRNQSISLSGLSGQIAYDMTNLNGSNAAVVSEIQALREDMDFMTDELTNMQIVMDTGALVGSTVGAYDQALGSRQVYSKRGTI